MYGFLNQVYISHNGEKTRYNCQAPCYINICIMRDQHNLSDSGGAQVP